MTAKRQRSKGKKRGPKHPEQESEDNVKIYDAGVVVIEPEKQP